MPPGTQEQRCSDLVLILAIGLDRPQPMLRDILPIQMFNENPPPGFHFRLDLVSLSILPSG